MNKKQLLEYINNQKKYLIQRGYEEYFENDLVEKYKNDITELIDNNFATDANFFSVAAVTFSKKIKEDEKEYTYIEKIVLLCYNSTEDKDIKISKIKERYSQEPLFKIKYND